VLRLARRHLDTCSWEFDGNRSKESGRSGAWFTSHASHFFVLCPKPIARFRCKRARLSLFRPQPHLPSFIQIHPSFRDLLEKTTFQIVIIIGDPIADKYPSLPSHIITGVSRVMPVSASHCIRRTKRQRQHTRDATAMKSRITSIGSSLL